MFRNFLLPPLKLRQLVTKSKRRVTGDVGRLKDVVYKITCRTCKHAYVGETGRPLQKRIADHRSAVAKVQNGLEGSKIVAAFAQSDCAVHAANGKYDEYGRVVKPFTRLHELDFDFTSLEVLDHVANTWSRKFHEAVHILTERPNFNRSCGKDVSPIYARLVNSIAGNHVL